MSTDTPKNWIRLAKYCDNTGDSPDAVHARRRKRQWTDGLHCKIGPDGNLWVCPEEVNRWIENHQQPSARSAAHAA